MDINPLAMFNAHPWCGRILVFKSILQHVSNHCFNVSAGHGDGACCCGHTPVQQCIHSECTYVGGYKPRIASHDILASLVVWRRFWFECFHAERCMASMLNHGFSLGIGRNWPHCIGWSLHSTVWMEHLACFNMGIHLISDRSCCCQLSSERVWCTASFESKFNLRSDDIISHFL